MKPWTKRLMVILATWLLCACGHDSDDKISESSYAVKVSSKADTEGAILGQIIIQTLEHKGIRTIHQLQLGDTQTVRSALLAGKIDIYPEYTGNGAFLIGEPDNPVWKDAAAAYAHIQKVDAQTNQVIWLTPAPANNVWSIALRRDLVDAHDLNSLGDLARWLNTGKNDFKLVASAEFVKRPDALKAMEQAHGFSLRPEQLIVLEGGDTSTMIQAAGQGTKGINAAMVYGTDEAIMSAFNLIILSDSKGSEIVYQPTPIIRESILMAKPRIKEVLDPVFRSLTAQNLKKLNARVTLESVDAKQVAIDYLKEEGFMK